MDVAASIQQLTEEIMMRLARSLRQDYDIENLCLAGGVALNCVGYGKILEVVPLNTSGYDLPLATRVVPSAQRWRSGISFSVRSVVLRRCARQNGRRLPWTRICPS